MYVDNEKFYSIKYDQFDFNEGDLVYTEKDYSFIKSGEAFASTDFLGKINKTHYLFIVKKQ